MSTSRSIIQHRLSRIEGQVRGLMNMVEDDRECAAILTQVAALRAALDSFGAVIVSNHVENLAGSSGVSSEKLDSLRAALDLFLK